MFSQYFPHKQKDSHVYLETNHNMWETDTKPFLACKSAVLLRGKNNVEEFTHFFKWATDILYAKYCNTMMYVYKNAPLKKEKLSSSGNICNFTSFYNIWSLKFYFLTAKRCLLHKSLVGAEQVFTIIFLLF